MRFLRISVIIGNAYTFHLITLLTSLKSLTKRTLPYFFAVKNVGEARSLSPCGAKTP